jgi:hypothetical protein
MIRALLYFGLLALVIFIAFASIHDVSQAITPALDPWFGWLRP